MQLNHNNQYHSDDYANHDNDKLEVLSDAQQDFESDYGDEYVHKNEVIVRSREWSPKPYSVSSNDEDDNVDIDHDDGINISPDHKDYNSDDYEETHN
jgi:hypothetical protein